MRDTSPEMEGVLRDKIMTLSNEERFIMGAQMFDSAREMVKESLPRGLSEMEQQRLLFKRIYGREIDFGN
jgi:hypothetical protein